MSDPAADDQSSVPDWKRRAALTEINGRRVNEAIDRGDSGEAPVFVCECGNLGCSATVRLPVEDYESVRSDFDRFLLVPGHELAEIDRVIERHPDHLVVEKRQPEARAMARETDPRDR